VTTYRARVSVDDGTLHTSRPLTAPEVVSDMIDSVVYTVREDGARVGVTGVELTFETAGESQTPIGDTIVGTSATPLPGAHEAADDDVDELDVPVASSVLP
jgi:hypothetical protein